LLAFQLGAQESERRTGEILVQLTPGSTIESITRSSGNRAEVTFELLNRTAPTWQIYLLGFDENKTKAETALRIIRDLPNVVNAQFNHQTHERDLTPNDPYWDQQDEMRLIKAPEVWASTTGGLTPNGDTIVIAVLESGALLTHPDLAPNRWYNRQEIPHNGIDDDGNGYVDDYGGWDVVYQKDSTGTQSNHGTGVNGIIGAAGNNDIGITGVNWNVKLMNIANDLGKESDVIGSYHYVDVMRRLYNSSKGKKGAFVVATNASFGIDGARPVDHPLWCAVYDSLGLDGILSVGATTNQNVDVDALGDVPSGCSSEFLITVNNINKDGTKMPNTGYGTKSIDLGAPGNNTYTTATSPSGYGLLGGCSAATPHVTGAIGLLYSLDCPVFTSDAITDPVTCARRVRDIVLKNTEPCPSEVGFTVTGGYLSLSRSLAAVRNLCHGIVGPLTILSLEDHETSIVVKYQTPDFNTYQLRVFNMLGQLIYTDKQTPLQFGTNSFVFSTSDLPAGIYVVSISNDKKIVSRKFRKI
jgi:subtilisin family serine protease